MVDHSHSLPILFGPLRMVLPWGEWVADCSITFFTVFSFHSSLRFLLPEPVEFWWGPRDSPLFRSARPTEVLRHGVHPPNTFLLLEGVMSIGLSMSGLRTSLLQLTQPHLYNTYASHQHHFRQWLGQESKVSTVSKLVDLQRIHLNFHIFLHPLEFTLS